jgi:dephospho-CoA kinase
MKVIGVTGLPGSGKSVVSRVAKNLNIPVVRMGDVIRDEAKKQNLTTGEVAVKLRKEHGEFVVAKRCVKTVKKLNKTQKAREKKQKNKEKKGKLSKGKKTVKRNKDKEASDTTNRMGSNRIYMIEGIRSPYEVEIFKKNFKNFKVIAVHSTPQTRFNRVKKRNRSDDSAKISEFQKRDKRELKFGIGDVIATADYMVINEGPLKKIKTVVRSMLKDEMQDDGKSQG